MSYGWQRPTGRPGYGPPPAYGRGPQQSWGNPWAASAGGWGSGPGPRPMPGPGRLPPPGQRRGPWAPAPYQPLQGGRIYSPNRWQQQTRSSTGCGVGLAIVAVVGVLFLAIPMAFLGMVSESTSTYSSYSSYTYSSYTTDYSTSDYTTQTTYTPEPTPDPTRSHGQGNYVNDGYSRPPVAQGPDYPYPPDLTQAEWWRTSNSLYNQTISQPIRCELPPSTEVASGSDEFWDMTDQYLTCLMGAWNQALTDAGYVLTTPTHYVVWGGAVTPCGNTHISGFAGLYCAANMGIIYMELDSYSAQPNYNADGLVTYTYEAVLAHEFGHHVQSRTGILSASSWWQQQLGTEEAYLENRRLELQVQCFAGLFLNAASQSLGLTQADRDALVDYYGTSSQSQTHGSGYHRGAWLMQGMNTTELSQCNTYLADPADLS